MNILALSGVVAEDPVKAGTDYVSVKIQEEAWDHTSKSMKLCEPVEVLVGGPKSHKKVDAVLQYLKAGGSVSFAGKVTTSSRGCIGIGTQLEMHRFGPKQARQQAVAAPAAAPSAGLEDAQIPF